MLKRLFLILPIFALTAMGAIAQGTSTDSATKTSTTTESTPKTKKPVFRSTKDQVKEAQTMLKAKNMFAGEATGVSSADWKAAVKNYQGGNGLSKTGSLNRATLEKMGIALTDKQKEIPVNPAHIGSTDSSSTSEDKAKPKPKSSPSTKVASCVGAACNGGDGGNATASPKKPAPFSATKDQIMALQKVLKDGKMFSGEVNGERSDGLKESVKKYQEANSLKVTGGINAATLEKAGIALTDKQKEQVAQQAAYDAAKAKSN